MPATTATQFLATAIAGSVGSAVVSPTTTIPPGTTVIGMLLFQGVTQTLTSVTDSVGNTWTIDHAVGSSGNVAWFRCNTTKPITPTDTLSFGFSLTTNANRFLWIEGFGNLNRNAYDQQADVSVGPVTIGGSVSAPTGTLSQADELAIGVLLSGNGTVFSTPTPDFSAFATVNQGNHTPTYENVSSTASASPSVTVSATGYSYVFSTATYRATSLAPVNSVAPVISGLPRVGASVAVSNTGTWTNDGAPAIFYAWQRDNQGGGVYSYISGPSALGAIYLPTALDIGCNLRCVVTQYDSNGLSAATSNVLGVVTAFAEVFAFINNKLSGLTADVFQVGEAFPAFTPAKTTSGTVYTDTGAIRSASSFSGSDTAQFVDSNTPRSKTTPSATETEQAVDANTVRSATGFTGADTKQTTDANSIRSATTVAGVDTEASVEDSSIRSKATFSIADTSQKVDSGSIRSACGLTIADTAQYVDSGAIRPKTTPGGSESLGASSDASSIRSSSSLHLVDTAQFVDTGAIRCHVTFAISDTAQFVDSSSVRSKTTYSGVETPIRTDANTVRSVSRLAVADVAVYIDVGAIRTVARFSITDLRVVLETGTIRSVTTFSGVEFSALPIPDVLLMGVLFARWGNIFERRQFTHTFYTRWSGICKNIRSVLLSFS